jgi:hypothetical protein
VNSVFFTSASSPNFNFFIVALRTPSPADINYIESSSTIVVCD